MQDLPSQRAVCGAAGSVDPRDPRGDPEEVGVRVRVEVELVDEPDLGHGPDDGEQRHHEQPAPAGLEGEECDDLVRVRVRVRVKG